jgi:hypothetical protein
MCPGQPHPGRQVPGRKLLIQERTRHGNRWLRTALIEAALAASVRSTKGAFAARYRRIMPHRGHKKAIVAVAHAMLVTAYHLLARQTTCQDPGLTTTTAAMPSASGSAPSRDSNVRASGLPSNPRPEREVNLTGDFLSKACSQSWRPAARARPSLSQLFPMSQPKSRVLLLYPCATRIGDNQRANAGNTAFTGAPREGSRLVNEDVHLILPVAHRRH